MDRAGIGIHWVESESGRFLYVNEYGAAMFGYAIEELLEMESPSSMLGSPEKSPPMANVSWMAARFDSEARGKGRLFDTGRGGRHLYRGRRASAGVSLFFTDLTSVKKPSALYAAPKRCRRGGEPG